MADRVIDCDVGPNEGDLGSIKTVGQATAECRSFALDAGALAGDGVRMLGANVSGVPVDGDFYPIVVSAPTGPAVALELTTTRARIAVTDRFTHVRTERVHAAKGSTVSNVALVVEDLPGNAPGATIARTFSIDYTEFASLGAGVKTFTKKVVNAADIPSGPVVLAVVGDGAGFLAFNDGTAPATNAFLGDASYGGGLVDTMNVGAGATGLVSPAYGDITLGNLGLPIEDINFTIIGANDLKNYTSGHLTLTLVLAAPASF